jgi:hypothetical protein
MIRTIIAAVAGFLGIGILVRFTDLLFAGLVAGWDPKAPPLYYFAVSLGTDFLYSIIGGFICAFIAEEHWRRATLWLIVVGEIIGIAAQVVLWKTVPHWYGIGVLILYPAGVWIGSSLRSKRTVRAA